MGRPGLLGTMARTAAITGTATAVHRSMTRAADRRVQDRAAADAYYAQQAQASPMPATAPPQQATVPTATGNVEDMTSKLSKLGELHAQGVLSDTEFAAAKAKLLS
ncbi:SHOCT domain-containing protein [Phytoactinopolyspora endophytica]|uniref:SHOCT domain-containing protein n=1 Tax=Phytoactinopolyspora endophytica TaxID=1642495 RepID=UPI00101C383B|nr:SHOCT domain-containing protein [Phytoactinopolyspora endophytica]